MARADHAAGTGKLRKQQSPQSSEQNELRFEVQVFHDGADYKSEAVCVAVPQETCRML